MKALSMLWLILIPYLVLLLLGFLMQANLIFHPGRLPVDYRFDLSRGAEEIFLETEDNERINGMYYPGSSKTVVLYFHGNAGDLSGWQQVSADFTEKGCHFLIIDYRGYGKSTGRISENGLYKDADTAFEFLIQEKGFLPEEIVVYGRSIGSGVAVDLASRNQVRGLVLESPYTSLPALANQKLPFLLPSLFLRYRFNNSQKLNRVSAPVLFLHGGDDSLIPASHSHTLFEAFKGKKELVIIEGGSHNDLDSFAQYHHALSSALNGLFEPNH